MNNQNEKKFFLQDISIIFLSVLIALILLKTDTIGKILISTKELELIGSFIAGMFFTSIFTAAPATVTLVEISQVNSILLTALFGALGAVFGDLIIFYFIRDRFGEHLMELLKHRGLIKRFKILLKLKLFRWFTFLIGAIIIASPFPDELGIGLLGFSKMRIYYFIPISFIGNSIGILLLGLVARSL